MPRSIAQRATVIGILANSALLLVKAAASGLSDSLTIFSETLNSLADLIAATAILICVRWAWQRPDATHPFGHRRAEPLAGLLVAIFTGILGFEVCRTATLDLWQRTGPEHIGPYPIVALTVAAIAKGLLAVYFGRKARQLHSPALRAAAVDSRNDVLIALQGLIAVVVAQVELPILDTLAALLVGVYILYSAYAIGTENIDYLMGRAPDDALLEEIRAAAALVPGVHQIGGVRGHYVGTFVHVELTARVDGSLTTHASHDLAEQVRDAVEQIPAVDRAFVHVEPAQPQAGDPATP